MWHVAGIKVQNDFPFGRGSRFKLKNVTHVSKNCSISRFSVEVYGKIKFKIKSFYGVL